MNANFAAIVKQLVAQHGEGILGDPQRLKPLFGGLAKNEPKPLRVAFGRCVEAGAYAALKTAPDAAERASRKAAIARHLRDDQGIDRTLCTEALDIIETTLFGQAISAAQLAPRQQPHPQTAYTPPPVQTYIPPQNQNSPHIQPQPPVRTGGLWTAVLVLNILGLNWISRFITGHVGTGILVLLLDIISFVFPVLLVAGLVIWIIDLVKIGTKKWQMSDGTYLSP
jgi:hypothetical protein